VIRPLGADDAPAYGEFCRALDREDLRLRLGRYVVVEDSCIRRMLAGEGDEVVLAEHGPEGEIVGVSRLVLAAEPEIAVIVRPGWKRRGIGAALVEALVATARARRLPMLHAYVLAENVAMLALARRLGFRAVQAAGTMVTLELPLGAAAARAGDAALQSGGATR